MLRSREEGEWRQGALDEAALQVKADYLLSGPALRSPLPVQCNFNGPHLR